MGLATSRFFVIPTPTSRSCDKIVNSVNHKLIIIWYYALTAQ